MGGKRILLSAAFILILVAGVVLGRLWGSLPTEFSPRHGGSSWLSDQLDLSGGQRKQMDDIWASTRREMGRIMQMKRENDTRRRQEIEALLTPAQKAEYDRINSRHQNERKELDEQRQAMIRQAEQNSRQLLNAEQQRRWDSMRKQWRQGRHDGAMRPSSRPADEGHGAKVAPMSKEPSPPPPPAPAPAEE